MQIDYELTQQDFIDSFAAHRNRNVFGKWLTRIFIWVVFGFAALLGVGLLVQRNAETAKALVPFFFLISFWIGIPRVIRWRSARNQFLKQPGAQGPQSVSLDGAGVHWRWNCGSSDVAWQNYIRVVEGRKHFLLYASPACFNIVPKRALTPETLLELQSLLKQNISKS